MPAAATPEGEVLARLAALTAAPESGAALVPRVPEIIPELMRLLRDEDMNVSALSRHLSQDPVLVAEVYREANRPCYRPRYHAGPPVSSIDAAVMLLGQNGMRMLLARVAFRPVMSMQSGRLARRVAPLIWRQSEKCAQAAARLAPAMRAHAFEAYLAGLMANIGLVVAFRLIDGLAEEGTVPQSPAFVEALLMRSRLLSAQIATLWDFPESVSAAINASAGLDPLDPGSTDAPPLARVLALADRLGKLRLLVDGARFAADEPFVVDGLGKAALACFAQLQDEDE
ncbi:HDOD domain-containing protein [Massilia sp. Se16.2.3]|uniref:HDOD domain-containing protein n=1 Tax=Massilia sp. Se16.2.3 TaxID=2709303 RepID=UPI001602EA67|nr:HDOD domain-containing protein [Massilia sp. Se16.2.3]QNB00034.1 HDOD domain-containing protein [Massilia sp. Se16.2.3]